MNPQLTTSLLQARQLELQRSAEQHRLVGELPSRPSLLIRMAQSVRAPRLNFRVVRSEAASWNGIN